MDVAPRTRIFGAVPNVPETFWTLTPAARPSSDRLTSAMPSSFALEASNFVAAPEKRRLSCWVMPVTTTSVSWWLSLVRPTFMPSLGVRVCVTMPM